MTLIAEGRVRMKLHNNHLTMVAEGRVRMNWHYKHMSVVAEGTEEEPLHSLVDGLHKQKLPNS